MIDLKQSNVEEIINNTQLPSNLDTEIQTTNNSTIDDTLYSIKENLQIQDNLPHSILNNLNCDQHVIFDMLAELNFEEVLKFGISLNITNTYNNSIVFYYIKYLFETVREVRVNGKI